MAAAPSTFAGRVAHRSLTLALRLWPEETREWGVAVLAELGEITEPSESFHWAAGGIMLFFRAVFSRALDWLCLPSGGAVAGTGKSGDGSGRMLPRPPRWVTAALLLGAIALLLLPQGREAVSTLEASWRDFELTPSDHRRIEELAVRAEKEKDAKGVAFAALSDPEGDEAVQYADRAVAMDPTLVWIYASRFYRPEDAPTNKEWMKRLQEADPENAFVYLYAAWGEAEPRLNTLARVHGVSKESWESALAGDAQWMELMGRAFRAPRYDSYYDRHRELSREVWSRERGLDVALVAYGLWSHPIPSPMETVTFAKFRIYEADKQLANKHPEQAEKIAGEVRDFGMKLTTGKGSYIERMTGLDIERRGLEALHRIYGATRRESEASAALAEVERLDAQKTQSFLAFGPTYAAAVEPYRWRAALVQYSALLGILSGLVALLCLFLLELGIVRARRVISVAADFGPLLFLFSSAVFLIGFRPFAGFLTEYRTLNQSSMDPRIFAGRLFVLSEVNPAASLHEPYVRWVVFTVALAVVAVGVLLRGILRRKRVA